VGIVLGPNRYGKAENRLLRVYRDTPRHEIRDLNVSTSLRGDFADAHVTGDQAKVLPTDTQKNTVFAFAKERRVGQIEEFALTLGRHFVDDIEPVDLARVDIEEFAWERIEVDGRGHDHSFVRTGPEVRTTAVTVESGAAWVVSGLKDLTVLKSTGSEFSGFLTDRYTTLPETWDRVLATSLEVQWRYGRLVVDWAVSYASVRAILLSRFATTRSMALQQSLWEMGRGVLEERPEVAEIRLSAPNRHHIAVDLTAFGLENPNEVFHATDRPYGVIRATAVRDDAPPAGPAWDV